MNDKEDDVPELPLNIELGTVKVGETYPLFGMITEILSEDPVTVVLNHNIKLILSIPSDAIDKINIIKDRVFETGIFVSKILVVDSQAPKYQFIGECQTVVYGRKKMTKFDA